MAKSYEPCYTRQSKSGTYTTCEGAQKKRKARAKLKKGGDAPVMVKKKAQSKPPPKKKKVGVNETPEQNEQKAFLKLQSKKISQGFSGNTTGRIETGTLNPANPNLSVNPWSVQPEIQANVPQSLGQQNLQLLLGLGDLSDKILEETKKNRYIPPEKWDPLSTPPLKLLTGSGNEAVGYSGEDEWSIVRIFNRNGTGKGKLYEATFQEIKGQRFQKFTYYKFRIDESFPVFKIVGIRDMETKKIIGFGMDTSNRWDIKSEDGNHPRHQFRFADAKIDPEFKYKKKKKGQTDIKYDIGKLVKWMERDSNYYNLPRESDKIKKAFKYGEYNDTQDEDDDRSNDLIYKVNFGTPVYSMRDLRIITTYTY